MHGLVIEFDLQNNFESQASPDPPSPLRSAPRLRSTHQTLSRVGPPVPAVGQWVIPGVSRVSGLAPVR